MRLKPFGMHLAGLKRHVEPDLAERLGLEWIGSAENFEAFLKRSEYLFLCLPLSPRTHNLMGAREIALLPSGACVINPARGGLINEDALVAALCSGHLSGAALDVFGEEPLNPHSRLLELRGDRHPAYSRCYGCFLPRHCPARIGKHHASLVWLAA